MTGREPGAGRGWSFPPPPCQEGLGPRATWVEGLSPRTIPQMGTDVTPQRRRGGAEAESGATADEREDVCVGPAASRTPQTAPIRVQREHRGHVGAWTEPLNSPVPRTTAQEGARQTGRRSRAGPCAASLHKDQTCHPLTPQPGELTAAGRRGKQPSPQKRRVHGPPRQSGQSRRRRSRRNKFWRAKARPDLWGLDTHCSAPPLSSLIASL